MKTTELLAPAGNKESFIGAINAGANAIYLAGKLFGARKYASNFTNEEITELIIYAHKRNVKVFVTINTIIFEEELTELFTYSDFLVSSNVNALIVQDIGVINEFVKRYPNTEIHASTQMNVYTKSQLEYLKSIGVKRAILARETSLSEIKKLSKVGLDLEVFIHGALCVSYSGNCLFSYFNGGRSGNRGECAQPCRLEYSLVKDSRRINEPSYLLSTKDLNTLSNLKDIVESGVVSLKIEGRMRKPEYVIATVRAYKEVLDNITQKQPFNINKRITELLIMFNREFTDGYISHIEPSSINNNYRPNHIGLEVGNVISYQNNKAKIKLSNTLKVNDGIRFIGNTDTGGKVSRILLNNQKVASAEAGQIIEIDVKDEVQILDKVHKTLDDELNQSLQPYLQENYKLIPLTISMHLFVSNRIFIEAKTPNHHISMYSDYIIEKAKQNPQTKEQILNQFNKFGNTYFNVAELNIITDEEGFIPNSILKKLRRTLVSLLEEQTLSKTSTIIQPETTIKEYNHSSKLIVKVETNEQLEVAQELGITDIYYTKNVQVTEAEKAQYYLYSDRIHDDSLINTNNLVIHDFGQMLTHQTKNIIASSYFNITNSLAIESLNVKRITLSRELNIKQIKALHHKNYPLEYIVYSRPDVMISKYCPITKSEGIYKQDCNLCMKHNYSLEDKDNNQYPIIRDHHCNVRILHHNIIRKDNYIKDLLQLNISIRLDFTTESNAQTKKIITKYLQLINESL